MQSFQPLFVPTERSVDQWKVSPVTTGTFTGPAVPLQTSSGKAEVLVPKVNLSPLLSVWNCGALTKPLAAAVITHTSS